jgi:hypothetical protein
MPPARGIRLVLFLAAASVAAASAISAESRGSMSNESMVTSPVDLSQGVSDWQVVAGQWNVETQDGAPILVQRNQRSDFNVIVAPAGPFSDVDASVRFKPLSGREDASGGIVFRFHEGKYYVIRANALENNFRLYAYDQSRRQIASASVTSPALGQWHILRVVAKGDRIQGYLDGTLLIDHRDARFPAGRVGLWTKADSVTAFADLAIRGVLAGGFPMTGSAESRGQ